MANTILCAATNMPGLVWHKGPDVGLPAPLQILHVVRPAAGGIRQHVISLVTGTDPLSVHHVIAAPEELLRSLPEDATVTRSALAIAPHFAFSADLEAAMRLASMSRGMDIVHAHGMRAAWIAALSSGMKRIPLIVTAHNVVDEQGFAARAGIRWIGQCASAIIAVSDAVARSLVRQGMPSRKIHVIPNGVAIDSDNTYPRRAFEGVKYTVGCIARLSPEKGVDVLLKAALLMPNMAFVIAGDGPLRDALEADSPPNVRYLGRIDDVQALLGSIHALAIPSRSEGQGLVALEAMAAGVPIVASRVGGLAEMLTDGQTALLVTPDQPSALANALRTMELDPTRARMMTAQAGELVRARYDIHKMIDDIMTLYRTFS